MFCFDHKMFLAILVLWVVEEFGITIGFIPGQSCGIITPIKKVEKPQDSDTCVIVLDEKEYRVYKTSLQVERECVDACHQLTVIDTCQHKGMRASGTDIKPPYTSHSLDDCWIDCVDDPSCEAYSWRCTDSLCELKGSGSIFEEDSCYISGNKQCSCATANLDRIGHDIAVAGDVHTMGQCQAMCMDTPGCEIFQYSTVRPKGSIDTGYCYMKAGGPKTDIVNPGFIAGPVSCT